MIENIFINRKKKKKKELDLLSVSRRVSEINLYYLFEEPLTEIVVFINIFLIGSN